MKAFSGYNETKAFVDFPKIVPGGYIAVIKNAEVKTFNGRNGDFEKLEISFDIAEGDFKDYYADQYRNNPSEDKKWKGKIALYIPTDDGSEADVRTKRRFKTAMTAIEESNNGYVWNWDERSLKNKKCGVVLQDKEWEFNGKTGWSAIPYSICSVEAIKNNSFYMPSPKALNGSGYAASVPAQTSAYTPLDESDLDLPF